MNNQLEKALLYAKNNTEYYKNIDNKNIKNNNIINKKIYADNTYPISDKMTANKKGAKFVFSTSGTTNNPQFIIRDIEDIDYQINDYVGLNLDENDIVLNLFWGGIWGVYTTNNLTLSKTNSTIIPYGGNNITNLNQLDILIKATKVNAIFGVPSTIVHIAKYYEDKEKKPDIKKIFCLGEKLDINTYEYIRKIFKNCNIKTKYGCMESAGIGYQCSDLSCNKYHIYNNRYVEILNPKTLKECKEKEIGKIVVTTLNERLVPLVRYDTGDIGYIENIKCKCGCNKVLTILNRDDDEFIVGSVHLSKKVLYNIIDQCNIDNSQYQIVIDKNNSIDEINIYINSNNIDELSIKNKIYELNPDLLYSINSNRVKEIKISKNKLYTNKISGKTTKFIDRR